ncbi:MAG: glycosyltransferase [Acidobacteriota bacterium]
MTTAAFALLAVSLLLAAWSYFVYPPLVRRLAARMPGLPRSSTPDGAPPSVEVLVSAAEEEGVIADRVRDLLAQDAPGPYRISIGCDGSRDATASRAREAGGDRVEVVRFQGRRGKAAVLNDLVAASRADILVFTDANTRFEAGVVTELCRALADPLAGAACGRLVLERGDGAQETPESEFWDRETATKEAEGRLGVCLGANGAIYAARRVLVPRLPPDTTSMDDFLIPVGVAHRGAAVVFAPAAVAREAAARDLRAEASRRFRIGVGAGQVLRRERWLWNARRRPRLALAFFSRKAARWLAPVTFLLAALAGLASAPLRPASAGVLALAAIAAASLRLRLPLRGIAGRLYYFAVINLVLAAGVAAGLCGYRRPAWKSVARA